MFLQLFHVSVVLLYFYTGWYDQKFVNISFPDKTLLEYPLKGRSTFLTHWCLTLQTTYFIVAVLNDFLGTNVYHPKHVSVLRTLKDRLFAMAFAIALYVFCAFWGIYAIDKELVYPEHISKEVPSWLNHSLHTLILLFMVIELFASYRKYPSRIVGCSLVTIFNMSYALWLSCVYFQIGWWVYPFLNVLSWPTRLLYIAVNEAISMGIYFAGEKLNNLVWSEVDKKFKIN